MRQSLILAAALALASCAGQGGKPQAEPTTAAEAPAHPTVVPFVRLNVDSTATLWSIRDNAEEHRMPNSLFYGDADSAEVEQLSPSGSVPSSVSCFILEAGGRYMLFDTGNGPRRGGQLVERMTGLGISPDSIDYIMLTHLHGDHTGGLSRGDTAVFGRAEVYVCQREYDHWVTHGSRDGQAAQALRPYASRLHLFEWGDELPMGVRAIDAHGHTPGHTAYQRGRLMVVGDLCHGLSLQMNDPNLCANYDMDRPNAIAARKRLLQEGEQQQMLFAGMHFPFDATLDFLVIEE